MKPTETSPRDVEQVDSEHVDLEHAVAAFLDAEGALREADIRAAELTPASAAEQALFALFAALPHPGGAGRPGAGFADAVLRSAGILRRDLGWLGRLATAAAYALVLVGAYSTLPIAVHWIAGLELGPALAMIVDLFSFLVARLGELAGFAERLVGFGRVLWLILLSPPVVLVSTLCAALTLLMGRWLAALLIVPRSSLHATAR